MIRKLQRKFIMITMMSLTLVMALLVGSINVINFHQTDRLVRGTIKLLADNQGKFPKFEKEKPPHNKPDSGLMNEETPYVTRYFSVEVNENSSIGKIDTSHITAVTSEDAAEYTAKVLSNGNSSGYKGIYKYAVVKKENGSMVIFVDCRSQLRTATLLLRVSVGVALATLILVFLLVSVFSRRAIKPIIISMEKQKQFITDAGHEIKTPLAIISANADVLELTGGENEWITSIRNQTNRLDKLVKNLLMLSKMDEDSIKLSFHDFDISRAVSEIAGSFAALAETQNKKLQMDIKPGLVLYGDENGIHQLVSTLLDNAMKYSNKNGTIKVSLSASKKGIKLEIYNTTDEIYTENLNQLFDRFYRVDSSRSRETGGYGIGLSIARSIVEAHHGKISVKSENGKSICFTVFYNEAGNKRGC